MQISPKIGMPTPSKPRTPNLEDIRFLIKSEKIEKLVDHMKSFYKIMNQSFGTLSTPTPPSFGSTQVELNDQELYDVFEKIEDKILWIVHSPVFEIYKIVDGQIISHVEKVDTTRSSLEDLNNYLNKDVSVENKYIALYSIYSEIGKYNTRFTSISDPDWKSKVRDEKIDLVLDKKSDLDFLL